MSNDHTPCHTHIHHVLFHSLVQGHGQESLQGSFTLNFDLQKYECRFNYANRSFDVEGQVTNVIYKTNLHIEDTSMNVALKLEEAKDTG